MAPRGGVRPSCGRPQHYAFYTCALFTLYMIFISGASGLNEPQIEHQQLVFKLKVSRLSAATV
eukprot:6180176-Pleurochrysis_carterae.AAC.1